MIQDAGCRILVARHDLHDVRAGPDPDAPAVRPLAEGQVRLAIDHFALTANNVTYGAFGDAMRYWNFFPSGDAALGCIPVWGFATVVESRAEAVGIGHRLYGYLPMGTHLVVQPARVDVDGFVDAAPHRKELAAVYNQLIFCAADPGYNALQEGQQALLRPLFTTAFLIDDFLADASFFGAHQIILTSASSKTAYGTAFCLSRRTARPRLVGLTSAAHCGFTQSLGCYDAVLAYEDISKLDVSVPAVLVDFSGNAAQRRDVHQLFADKLLYSCAVGGTHWRDLGGSTGLAGPRPLLFFAPAQIKKRSSPAPEGWGHDGLQQRLAEAWSAFMRRVNDPARPWLHIQTARGAPAVMSAYLALLDGNAAPCDGLMLAL